MKHAVFFASMAVAFATIFTAGCTQSSSGVVFSRDEALRGSEIYEGTVVEVRAGKIEGEQSGVGAIGGAAMGGVVGNLFGGGKGNTIATVGGALAGGLAGNAVEKGVTSSKAYQITVRLDNGKTIMVVQETDQVFVPEQRVRVVVTGGKSRVQPL